MLLKITIPKQLSLVKEELTEADQNIIVSVTAYQSAENHQCWYLRLSSDEIISMDCVRAIDAILSKMSGKFLLVVRLRDEDGKEYSSELRVSVVEVVEDFPSP